MKRLALVTALLVPVLALGACSSGTSAVTDVKAAEATSIATQSDVTVLDVRTPGEYAAGHIPRAINIDVEASDFNTKVQDLPKDSKYFVYCRSGNRSGIATDRMAKAGFTTLYDLQGGIQQWSAAGGSIVS